MLLDDTLIYASTTLDLLWSRVSGPSLPLSSLRLEMSYLGTVYACKRRLIAAMMATIFMKLKSILPHAKRPDSD